VFAASCRDEIKLPITPHGASTPISEKMPVKSAIHVELVLERDLCRMGGFWDHALLIGQRLDDVSTPIKLDELLHKVASTLRIPMDTFAIFWLDFRIAPLQVRFAAVDAESLLSFPSWKQPVPHFNPADPRLILLCVASDSYDPWTLKPTSSCAPAEVNLFSPWDEDRKILLVVKYVCTQSCTMVTLGCWCGDLTEKLSSMITTGWVLKRLQPHIISGAIKPCPNDSTWQCWEEYSDRECQPRSMSRTMKSEELWSGDVIIWQVSKQDGANGDTGSFPTVLSVAGKKRLLRDCSSGPVAKYARKVWLERKFADLVIKCSDGEVLCHRAYLASASAVLAAMLQSNMREGKEQQIEVPEPAHVVEAMLEFLHTGVLTSTSYVQLLPLADRYGIDDLVTEVASKMVESVTPESVVSGLRALQPYAESPGACQCAWKALLESASSRPQLLEAIAKAL